MQTLPLSVRELRATEARLQAIYDAAKLGLKGDSLALAAGMQPVEYRRLCELDPLAALAAQKGRADAELELSKVMFDAAKSGDTKAALAVLQHRHDWTARQEVSVDITNRISIIAALEQAQQRIDSLIIDEAQERANAPELLTNQLVEEVDYGSSKSNASSRARAI